MKLSKAKVRKMAIGQIAASVPHAAQLFYRFKLDFCCHGDDPLSVACQAKGVNENEVLEELHRLLKNRKEPDWSSMSKQDLVEHILDAYHQELHSCLPDIIRLARKVEEVHADHMECPTGLGLLLQSLWDELEPHLKKEEKHAFPFMKKERGPENGQPLIQDLMREHVAQGESLRKIRLACREYALPKGACRSWQALYSSLEELEKNLIDHIHVENNILFERVLTDGIACAPFSRMSEPPETGLD